MNLQFIKAEGLGNDFVMLDCAGVPQSDEVGAKARVLCDRRLGVGADGVICVLPAAMPGADYRMRIFNSDGSEAEMCGNGVRCFGEYLRATGRAAERVAIETLAGLIEVEFAGAGERGGQYRVNMGPPKFAPKDIPVLPADLNDTDFVMKEVSALGRAFAVTAVSMGNPHAVIFADELGDDLVQTYGPAIQKTAYFPKSVNVEFVKVLSSNEIRMRVYERGCGETQACGTGACAAVAAGIATEKLENDVTVHLLGGDLGISWDGYWEHPVYMTGPARVVFGGSI
ncbi:MAG: diaminopimelate epimerase [Chitinispirillia bacterium]|nr:diaminopimelate epimerase [Chitinispirillia bacterium]MCL2241096.1 diaminopimelate epimerase [Chitinispirillia bacterium]